ncbi:MAG: hypothetical protein AAF567_05930 [Actinomycetota bacterium]
MSLAQAFAKGNGRRTKHAGETIHSLLRLDVAPGDRLTVTRVAASRRRAQAIKLAVDRGDVRANGVVVPSIAIWSHTAPEQAELQIVGKRARSIDLWNAWSFQGVVSEWLGNAGMIVEDDGAAKLLRCSDGLGEPSFDDLVVRVEVHHGR